MTVIVVEKNKAGKGARELLEAESAISNSEAGKISLRRGHLNKDLKEVKD